MRCNAGVPPSVLTDQHLIAEYRELMIPIGQLRQLGWKSKSPIPKELKLGKGHVTFWRDKQVYLKRRHEALVEEMKSRGFNTNYTFFDLDSIPQEFVGDWQPTYKDTLILRERIWEKFQLKPEWYRYKGKPILEQFSIDEYKHFLYSSPVEF